jgi:hypothetical protein
VTPTRYPPAWLDDLAAGGFAVRYPWVDELDRAAGGATAVLVPPAAGPLAAWAGWVQERLDARPDAAFCLTADGTPTDLADVLAAKFGDPRDRGEFRWDRFLARCRAEMPRVRPTPVVLAGPTPDTVAAVTALLAAQRQLGYPLLTPVLVAEAEPAGWSERVVWFGPPEPVGDLHRIHPMPHDDPPFWTRLLLALATVWECGGVPPLADQLWDEMTVGRHPSLIDPGFDDWLGRTLKRFADKVRWGQLVVPTEAAFAPRADAPIDVWQAGAVVRWGTRFDLTPAFARGWAAWQPAPARDAVRRRVLANGPFVRWLAAWAASAEESLRVAALRHGGAKALEDHLRRRAARIFRGQGCRWDELNLAAGADPVAEADVIDLTEFVCDAGGLPFPLLDQFRMARNRVVHERAWSAADVLAITRAVELLDRL